jgi:hypothetical protein
LMIMKKKAWLMRLKLQSKNLIIIHWWTYHNNCRARNLGLAQWLPLLSQPFSKYDRSSNSFQAVHSTTVLFYFPYRSKFKTRI